MKPILRTAEIRARNLKAVERRIARRCVRDLLAAGYLLAVHDGEQLVTNPLVKASQVMAAMFSVDEERLIAYRADVPGYVGETKRVGWVFFIYGESGWDVVNDYTTNLEHVMSGVCDYANKFDI